MGSEKQFENRIKDFLKEQGCYPLGEKKQNMKVPPCGYWVKRWGGGRFTKSGLPDMQIMFNGLSIDCEIKADDGKPSALQLHNLRQIDDAGGFAILLYPDQFEVFKNFIRCLKARDYYNIMYNYHILKGRWSEDAT